MAFIDKYFSYQLTISYYFYMKKLVVYFSREGSNWVNDGVSNLDKGNTEILAEFIKDKVGADIFKITTNQRYTDDYYKCTEEAKNELKNNYRPEINNCPDNLDEYDIIYLGYPIWWGTFPVAVFSFLEKFNWNNKTIYPFCTHEGSGISNSVKDIEKICIGATVKPYFETRGFMCQNMQEYNLDEKLTSWLAI